MSRKLAILLVAWSLCVAPSLCVAGVLEHPCEDGAASDCEHGTTTHCEDKGTCPHAESCPHDPCSALVVTTGVAQLRGPERAPHEAQAAESPEAASASSTGRSPLRHLRPIRLKTLPFPSSDIPLLL
jgi:hypothetical protein